MKDILHIDFSSLDDFEANAAEDLKLMSLYVEYYQLRRFLFTMADKTIAVDPLDRALWTEIDSQKIGEGNREIKFADHGTKLKDVRELIKNLIPADGSHYSAPFDVKRYDCLTRLIEIEITRVANILKNTIDNIL